MVEDTLKKMNGISVMMALVDTLACVLTRSRTL